MTTENKFKEDCDEPIQTEARTDVTREDTTRKLEAGVKQYSQWFPGNENDVSDALSRDDDKSDKELTNTIRSFVPSQVPSYFEIVPLPNKISS